MKPIYTQLKFISVALFILSVLYTTYELSSLQSNLILEIDTLSTSDIIYLSPIITRLSIVVGISFLFAVISISINISMAYKSVNSEIYSENQKSIDDKKESNLQSDQEDVTTLDLSNVQAIINQNIDKKEKYGSVLNALCKKIEAGQGVLYLSSGTKEKKSMKLFVAYAYHISESNLISFDHGEGLIGQVAEEGKTLHINDVPENYINIISGLGSAPPSHLLITPILDKNKIIGVVEIVTFKPFKDEEIQFIKNGINLLASTPPKK